MACFEISFKYHVKPDLDEVPHAVNNAGSMPHTYLNGFRLVNKTTINGSTTRPWINKPDITVIM